MSKNTNNTDIPFTSEEIKEMKNELKRIIDIMPSEEFLDFVAFLMEMCDDYESFMNDADMSEIETKKSHSTKKDNVLSFPSKKD